MTDEYSQIVNIGSFFVGVGIMIVLFVIAYLIWQFARMYSSMADLEIKYSLMEEIALDRIAKKRGIDLNKEMMRKDIFKKNQKSFRGKLRQEAYEDMFGKDKEDK